MLFTSVIHGCVFAPAEWSILVVDSTLISQKALFQLPPVARLSVECLLAALFELYPVELAKLVAMRLALTLSPVVGQRTQHSLIRYDLAVRVSCTGSYSPA